MGIVIKNHNNETIFEIAPSAKILKHTITNWLSRKNEIYELNWEGESKDTNVNNEVFDAISHLNNLITLSFINTQFSRKAASKLFAAIPKNIESLVLDGCFRESIQIDELGAKIKAGAFPHMKSIQITHCHIQKSIFGTLARQILEQKTLLEISMGMVNDKVLKDQILDDKAIQDLLGWAYAATFNKTKNNKIIYEPKPKTSGKASEKAAGENLNPITQDQNDQSTDIALAKSEEQQLTGELPEAAADL